MSHAVPPYGIFIDFLWLDNNFEHPYNQQIRLILLNSHNAILKSLNSWSILWYKHRVGFWRGPM